MAKKPKLVNIVLSNDMSDLDRERLQLALASLFSDDTKIMGHAEERRSAITITLSSGQTERTLIPDFNFVKRPSRLEGQWCFEAFQFSALEGHGGFGHVYPASFYIKFRDNGKAAIRYSTKAVKLQNKVKRKQHYKNQAQKELCPAIQIIFGTPECCMRYAKCVKPVTSST